MIDLLNATLPIVGQLHEVKKILRKLGISEVSIGLSCIVLGVVVAVDANTPRFGSSGAFIYINYREGIWGGAGILAAGVLGIICGKRDVTPCLINNHLLLSVFGSTFGAVMLAMSLTYGILYLSDNYILGAVIEFAISVLGLVAMGLCFSSAKYCVQATRAAGLGGCCGGGCSCKDVTQDGVHLRNQQPATIIQQPATIVQQPALVQQPATIVQQPALVQQPATIIQQQQQPVLVEQPVNLPNSWPYA